MNADVDSEGGVEAAGDAVAVLVLEPAGPQQVPPRTRTQPGFHSYSAPPRTDTEGVALERCSL